MEKDWILKDHERLNGTQIMGLMFLLELSGIERCIAHRFYTEHEFRGIAITIKKGNYTTFMLPEEEDLFAHCREISYDELIGMLEGEIKLKSYEKSYEQKT